MIDVVNIADLQDPSDPEGRSYREVNASKVHRLVVGTLVELDTGERLRVMHHTRDCDQSPLYSLGLPDCPDHTWVHGYGEESLTVCEEFTPSNKDDTESFCDMYCSWADHHPDCVFGRGNYD